MTDWQDQALCLGTGPDKWFPSRGEVEKGVLDTCCKCPVRRDCFEAALEEDRRTNVTSMCVGIRGHFPHMREKVHQGKRTVDEVLRVSSTVPPR